MAESDPELAELLRQLGPVRNQGTFAFCRLPEGEGLPESAVGWFREAEGASVIVPTSVAAEKGWPADYVAAWITLSVNSDLAAVGLTAVVSGALAEEGISCNVVAAVRHDHLFVPADRADETMRILTEMQQGRSPLG